jgi:hypothetical protein
MFVYNVTVSIDPSIEKDWVEWMKSTHVPQVMATGMFIEHKMLKLLTEVEDQGVTYAMQYLFDDMAKYDRYQAEFAPALQADHTSRYKDRFVAFRTVLQLI